MMGAVQGAEIYLSIVYEIGDYESGIETLVGAISLIKQSPTAAEERCQVSTIA